MVQRNQLILGIILVIIIPLAVLLFSGFRFNILGGESCSGGFGSTIRIENGADGNPARVIVDVSGSAAFNTLFGRNYVEYCARNPQSIPGIDYVRANPDKFMLTAISGSVNSGCGDIVGFKTADLSGRVTLEHGFSESELPVCYSVFRPAGWADGLQSTYQGQIIFERTVVPAPPAPPVTGGALTKPSIEGRVAAFTNLFNQIFAAIRAFFGFSIVSSELTFNPGQTFSAEITVTNPTGRTIPDTDETDGTRTWLFVSRTILSPSGVQLIKEDPIELTSLAPGQSYTTTVTYLIPQTPEFGIHTATVALAEISSVEEGSKITKIDDTSVTFKVASPAGVISPPPTTPLTRPQPTDIGGAFAQIFGNIFNNIINFFAQLGRSLQCAVGGC